MPSVNIYSKEQIDNLMPSSDELVPDTSGASNGDVLTYDGTDIGWMTPSGGVTRTTITNSLSDLITAMHNANAGSIIVMYGVTLGRSGEDNNIIALAAIKMNSTQWAPTYVETLNDLGNSAWGRYNVLFTSTTELKYYTDRSYTPYTANIFTGTATLIQFS